MLDHRRSHSLTQLSGRHRQLWRYFHQALGSQLARHATRSPCNSLARQSDHTHTRTQETACAGKKMVARENPLALAHSLYSRTRVPGETTSQGVHSVLQYGVSIILRSGRRTHICVEIWAPPPPTHCHRASQRGDAGTPRARSPPYSSRYRLSCSSLSSFRLLRRRQGLAIQQQLAT